MAAAETLSLEENRSSPTGLPSGASSRPLTVPGPLASVVTASEAVPSGLSLVRAVQSVKCTAGTANSVTSR